MHHAFISSQKVLQNQTKKKHLMTLHIRLYISVTINITTYFYTRKTFLPEQPLLKSIQFIVLKSTNQKTIATMINDSHDQLQQQINQNQTVIGKKEFTCPNFERNT